jgi:hypothetical protein
VTRPGLISVRAEVVRETLVARIVELIRTASEQPAPAVAELLANPPPGTSAGSTHEVGNEAEGSGPRAERLAHAGYRLRLVEWRLFEPARRPTPGLAERLRERIETGVSRMQAIAMLSRELAEAEPLERPRPDDERAGTWRVPGPGGHVRHYVAQELIGAGPPELKRAFVYGFFVRCCEEAIVRQARPQRLGPL